MKNTVKKSGITILAIIIIFLMGNCKEDPENNNSDNGNVIINNNNVSNDLPIHYEELDFSNLQVWWRNDNATKLSEVGKVKYDGDSDLTIYACNYTDGGYNTQLYDTGTGKIQDGLLSFKIEEPLDLISSDDLIDIIFRSRGWKNTVIDKPGVRGNIITLMLDEPLEDPANNSIRDYALIALGVTGTSSSLKGAYVHYVYVDGDCEISDDEESIVFLQYTFKEFNLSLKRGWNTVYMSETYTTEGYSIYTMELKHPELKWLLWPTN